MAIPCQILDGFLDRWLNVEFHIQDKDGDVLVGPLRKSADGELAIEIEDDGGELNVCFYADGHIGDWVAHIWSYG